MNLKDIEALIRPIPDYPKPGILFKDITPVLGNSKAFEALILEMSATVKVLESGKDRIQKIVGICNQ